MTTLCEMILECRAIKGMDKLVLYGWAAQLAEGNDTLYASKETVAEFIGVSDDTVLRKTKALVKDGWLIDTGERKQWAFGWTPVRTINVPVIVELFEAQYRNLRPPAECTPPQNAAQGYRFRFPGSFDSPFSAPAVGEYKSSAPKAEDKSKEVGQTKNLELRTVEPKPTPTPHGQSKSCSDCGEPLQRDVNHFLVCKVAKGNSELDEYLGDMPPCPNLDGIGELMNFDKDDDYDGTPLFPFGQKPNGKKAEEAKQRVEAVGQKTEESIMEEGRTTPTATHAHNNVPPICTVCAKSPCRSLTSDYCIDCWNERQRTGVIPKFVDEIRPIGY
jgi:hypothetical protein